MLRKIKKADVDFHRLTETLINNKSDSPIADVTYQKFISTTEQEDTVLRTTSSRIRIKLREINNKARQQIVDLLKQAEIKLDETLPFRTYIMLDTENLDKVITLLAPQYLSPDIVAQCFDQPLSLKNL